MDTIHNQSGCFYRALDDEPLFVLLARDPVFAEVIRYWTVLREAMIGRGEKPLDDHAMLEEAIATASQGHIWRQDSTDPAKWLNRPRWKHETPKPRMLVRVPESAHLPYDEWTAFRQQAMPIGNRFLLGYANTDPGTELVLSENETWNMPGHPEKWGDPAVVPQGMQGAALSQAHDDWQNLRHEKAAHIKALLQEPCTAPEGAVFTLHNDKTVTDALTAIQGQFPEEFATWLDTLPKAGTPAPDEDDSLGKLADEMECWFRGDNGLPMTEWYKVKDKVLGYVERLRAFASGPVLPDSALFTVHNGKTIADVIESIAEQNPDDFKTAIRKRYPNFIAVNLAVSVATRLRKAKQRLDGEISSATWPNARKERMRSIGGAIQVEIDMLEDAAEKMKQYETKPAGGIYANIDYDMAERLANRMGATFGFPRTKDLVDVSPAIAAIEKGAAAIGKLLDGMKDKDTPPELAFLGSFESHSVWISRAAPANVRCKVMSRLGGEGYRKNDPGRGLCP